MTPADRICEMAFAPITDVMDWLRTFPNLTLTEPRPGTFQVRREDGFICGLMELAPIDQGIAIALALLGPLWARALPDLVKRIDDEFQARKKTCSRQQV